MHKIFSSLLDRLSQGEDLVLASVTASSGATPRTAGAMMLVGKEGLIAGTIGGGNVEHRSIQLSQQLLESKASSLHDYVLNRSDVEDLGMICGGDVTVHFYYLDPADASHHTVARAGLASLEEHQAAALLSGIKDEEAILLLLRGGEIVGDTRGLSADEILRQAATGGRNVEVAGIKLAVQPISLPERVVIVGGGHVGQALTKVLALLDYAVVVLEDREEFLDPSLFPEKTILQLVDFENIVASFTFEKDDEVCIMTRGHRFDQITQAQVLKSPARYIGVIGSRHKSAKVGQNLKELYGFTDEDLARITSPIGLDIMAETPEEIAISIAAQLIEERARNGR